MGGELAPIFRKHFDIIVDSNDALKEKATSLQKSDLFEIWRPSANKNEYWEIDVNLIG
ncbi:hypothetical protein GSbR_04970 [Geobacter sp. SVR]|nr:hypothetical protein GSVR_09730 [Geobacter sp. SVR]GCF83897.1 hypothetical protein GSbR_04970 [Geobacter sp. SVR]